MNYQNYRQKLNQQLNDKVQQELSAFQKEMLSKSPQEIFDAAYQITIKMILQSVFLTQIILRKR